MFPITITITVNNEAELARLVLLKPSTAAAFQEATTTKKPTTSAATQASAAPTQRTAAADAETAAPAKTAAETNHTAESAEGEQPLSTAATEVTLDGLIAQFRAFCKVQGVPAAQAVLAEFKLEKVSQAKPEQYAALYQRFSTEG